MNTPSRRRLFPRFFSWRFARRALLATAILGTLIAAFYVVENTRGRRAWEQARELLLANGYTLPRTLADLAPPPVLPEDNAAETPLLRALHHPDPAVAEAARTRWPALPYEAVTPAMLEQHSSDLAELAEAFRRPHLYFPEIYQDETITAAPSLGALFSVARLFSARATLRLQENDPAGAAADILSLLHLARLRNSEGLLISQLTVGAISQLAVDGIASGLARGAWNAGQRTDFSEAIARVDLVAGLHRGYIGEMNVSLIYFETFPDLRALMPDTTSDTDLLLPFLPSGWFDQSRAVMSRIFMEDVIPSFDVAARRVNLAQIRQTTEEVVAKKRNIASGHAFAAFVFRHLDRLVVPQVEHQTRLDHARLALALADWRETHGSYPATLAELPAAAGLGNLHDLFTGQPFAYRPAADRASYRLYAFGPDGHDDGGAPPAKDERNPKDWVWPGGGEGVLGK